MVNALAAAGVSQTRADAVDVTDWCFVTQYVLPSHPNNRSFTDSDSSVWIARATSIGLQVLRTILAADTIHNRSTIQKCYKITHWQPGTFLHSR